LLQETHFAINGLAISTISGTQVIIVGQNFLYFQFVREIISGACFPSIQKSQLKESANRHGSGLEVQVVRDSVGSI
jgi:hypothetical protein